jgi:hypothetical protein
MDETDDENENKEEGIDKRERWQLDIFTAFNGESSYVVC